MSVKQGQLQLNDWSFTGQTDDPGTGLIDYNARHYDPQLGRFVMADTVLDGLNRYGYVRNNQLNATDPSGHCVDRIEVSDSGAVKVWPTPGYPECDPHFGPVDSTFGSPPAPGEPFYLGQSQIKTIKDSDTTRMLMDSGEYKISECSPTAHWNHEAISCFWPNEASASPSMGYCAGGGVYAAGGGEAAFCWWTLSNGDEFFSFTIGGGGGVEGGVGGSVVLTNADERSDLEGFFGCVGGGAGIVGGTFCMGTDAWTLQGSAVWAPGPVLPGVTMGFHGSGTWTWTFGSVPPGLENEADKLRAQAEQ